MKRPIKLLQTVTFCISLLLQNAAIAAGYATEQVTAASTDPHDHDPGSNATLIRHHRLGHLQAKLTVDPVLLQAQCRYESELSTSPPAKKVVLTFDDGPEPGQTEHILETLKRHHIAAVFFLIGSKAQKYPELVEKIQTSGQHVIGNHSWDHPNFHAISADAQAVEVEKSRQVLPQGKAIALFRYPFGNSTCETNTLVHSMGYAILGWHIDSCDWAFDRAGSVDAKEAMICGVLPQYKTDYVRHVVSSVRAHHGGIILMHEIHPNTVRQLEEIILGIRANGYDFASVNESDFAASLR